MGGTRGGYRRKEDGGGGRRDNNRKKRDGRGRGEGEDVGDSEESESNVPRVTVTAERSRKRTAKENNQKHNTISNSVWCDYKRHLAVPPHAVDLRTNTRTRNLPVCTLLEPLALPPELVCHCVHGPGGAS